MKRFYICVLTLFFAAMQIIAAPVDPERALEIANDFWASNISLKKNIQSRLVPAEGALKASSRTASSNGHDTYYVFTETGNNGFVIVSGDDRLNPIVGYSTNAVSGEMPPALTAWLDEYSEYVNDVRTGKTEPLSKTARQTYTHIEPMLVTAWDQDAPYNNMCPILSNGKRGYTGCGNTATAQVMKFHNWPASPIADVEWNNNITGETEFCEMKSHVYDWDNMLYNYNSEYSETQGNAVALLMADLGKATQTTYMPDGSGNNSPNIVYALVHVFNYSPELFIAERSDYTYEEYIALIRENLNNRQPIVYCGYGQNMEVGHGFVCDGIDENNLLHIDWGWNGLFNGYFDMAIMEPGGNGIGGFSSRYNVSQHAIMNIKPRAEGEVNRGGNLSLDRMNVFDMNTWGSVDEMSCEYVDGMAEVSVSFRLVNMSHSDIEGSIGYGILDKDGNLVKDIEFGETDLYPRSLEQSYKNGFTIEVSNVNGSEEYLPAGKYIVCLFFMNTEEEIEYIRSACNGLILEVTENEVTLSSPKPSYELGEFRIIKMPEHSHEKFVFNATFANNSKTNKMVVLVPVINHYENGVKVKSEVKTEAAVTTLLLDTNNILVTFTIPEAFAQSGTYTISFEYLFDEEKTETIDTNKLKSIAGESAPFEAEIIPVDVDKLDYSFSVEFIGQETEDETEVAILRATMGADISEYKFFVTNSINEDTLKAIAEDIISGKCENCYTMKRSANLRLLLGAGEYAIVIVTYDIDGKPLNGYYTQVFSLTTGLEKIEDKGSEIHIDWNNSVISVAKDGIIELLDASGRLVKRVNGNNISIADLETGIYIVKYNEDIVKVVKR
ncbi:MAG: thiol protease/hemagglutinin PrtT [Bacteroidaceae bacterium]|nr:thiol protease/hemagglutinin PrtT [Bacteroidaceae bacterium]